MEKNKSMLSFQIIVMIVFLFLLFMGSILKIPYFNIEDIGKYLKKEINISKAAEVYNGSGFDFDTETVSKKYINVKDFKESGEYIQIFLVSDIVESPFSGIIVEKGNDFLILQNSEYNHIKISNIVSNYLIYQYVNQGDKIGYSKDLLYFVIGPEDNKWMNCFTYGYEEA